jgi:hypothetical protein
VADPAAKALVEPFLTDEALKQEAQNALDKINKSESKAGRKTEGQRTEQREATSSGRCFPFRFLG